MIKLTKRNIGVEPRFYDNRTESGILYIPEDSIRRANQGVVKYVGPDVSTVSIGDYVLFSGYSGTTVRLEEGVIIILHEEFITCKIAEEIKMVPGLFLREKSRGKGLEGTLMEFKYFPATLDAVVKLIKESYTQVHAIDTLPHPGEYDKPE